MYFFTLVVRYFADAQYDVRSPIVGFADTLPEGESEISFAVFASGAKQSPGRVAKKLRHSERSEESHR